MYHTTIYNEQHSKNTHIFYIFSLFENIINQNLKNSIEIKHLCNEQVKWITFSLK